MADQDGGVLEVVAGANEDHDDLEDSNLAMRIDEPVKGERFADHPATRVLLPATAKVESTTPETSRGNKTKRFCKFPGCQRVVKSQGHCQRHGAKAKRCRAEGCDKQAQGTFDGKTQFSL